MLPIDPYLLAIGPGLVVVAAGVIALFLGAARRRPSILPSRLIVGGMGLMLLGGAVLGLMRAIDQSSLIGLLAVALLAGPGLFLIRLGLLAREYEANASGTRAVGLDLGFVWRDVGRWQVIVSAGLMVAIVVMAITSGQVVLALLAIGPAITLLTGAALASIEQPNPTPTTDRSASSKGTKRP